MCYRIRQEQTEDKVSGTTLTPPTFDRLRPRLVGAAAAALVASIAAAALVMPSSQQTPRTTAQSAAPALPLAERTAASGTQEQGTASSGVIEQTSTSEDDGVPSTNTGVARTAAGGCNHAL